MRPTTPARTTNTRAPPTRTTLKFTSTEGHQRHENFHFTHVALNDQKIIETDDNEAETLPNIEIIPFDAHDAIDTDNKPFEPYLKPYDNLEKDYFANDKEKPFRYNNKFIHHSYDDSGDYGYSNPHERIDNGPYYFETNDNQFDSFSPPSEQDFLGKDLYQSYVTSIFMISQLTLVHLCLISLFYQLKIMWRNLSSLSC